MTFSFNLRATPVVPPINMRQFLAFVTKEFRHIFRDRPTTIILIGLPVVLLFLFGFAITTEVKNTRVAVYAPTEDQATRHIIERLAANEYFILAYTLSSPADIATHFASGGIGLVVVFSENFEREMMRTGAAQIQLIADGADPNTAKTLVNYAEGIIRSYLSEQQQGATAPYTIIPDIKLLYNPSMKGAYNYVPGVMGMILLLVCSMMTSISIAREKETGTMEVLLVSPVKPLHMILAKTVPYFVISVVDLVIILLVSVYVLEVPIKGSLTLLVATTLIYIFLSLAVGILISTFAASQMTALLISGMAMMMPVMMLSGMMFPLESMPRVLQLLGQLVPAKWFIEAVRKIMIRGQGLDAVLTELAVLSVMALALILISLKLHRERLG